MHARPTPARRGQSAGSRAPAPAPPPIAGARRGTAVAAPRRIVARRKERARGSGGARPSHRPIAARPERAPPTARADQGSRRPGAPEARRPERTRVERGLPVPGVGAAPVESRLSLPAQRGKKSQDHFAPGLPPAPLAAPPGGAPAASSRLDRRRPLGPQLSPGITGRILPCRHASPVVLPPAEHWNPRLLPSACL